MKTLFRADSSSSIGMGHIMRDLVLAKRLGGEISFACLDLEGNIMSRIPYPVHLLKEGSAKELIDLIRSDHYEQVVFDHYGIDKNFEKQIKEETGLEIMVLDDTYQRHHCDILLNHNIYAKKKFYKNLVPKHCKVYCGAKHTLLRDEFIKTTMIAKTNSLLIAMGGTDVHNFTLEIIKLLPHNFSQHVNIITTNANKNINKLRLFIQKKSFITLHIDTKELAKLAKQASLAIITPSVLANELYALDVPFIAIQSAKNQKYMRKFLKKEGYTVFKKFSRTKLRNLLKNHML